MKEIGASWIATTDYRTYAMLRWHLKDRVPVIQVNERARFMGFRDPDMSLVRGHAGLYIARDSDDANSVWASTSAVLAPIGHVDRSWRGFVMSGYVLKKLTGWAPDLKPQPDSPLYQWRWLAGDLSGPPRDGRMAVVAVNAPALGHAS
jgi:hypothetical protein